MTSDLLIVVPTLNEAATVERLCRWLSRVTESRAARIVVADGGSSDGTRAIVLGLKGELPRLELLVNPKRIQSAGINAAVDAWATRSTTLVRIDAHGEYPEDFVDQLLAEADAKAADAVVVSMETVGRTFLQRAVASAQNSVLGNGGSAHRTAARGEWVDHGHHALIKAERFIATGGYDERMSHNEDAELDRRLINAGARIWLTSRTSMTYFPRAKIRGLFKQYYGYGRGRAINLRKHRTRPRLRQMVPLGSIVVLLCAALTPLTVWALIPISAYVAACIGLSAGRWVKSKDLADLAAFIPAVTMHVAWASGFLTTIWRRPLEHLSFVGATVQK